MRRHDRRVELGVVPADEPDVVGDPERDGRGPGQVAVGTGFDGRRSRRRGRLRWWWVAAAVAVVWVLVAVVTRPRTPVVTVAGPDGRRVPACGSLTAADVQAPISWYPGGTEAAVAAALGPQDVYVIAASTLSERSTGVSSVVQAVQTSSGKVRWQFPVNGRPAERVVASADTVVVVVAEGAGRVRLSVLDAATGRPRWTTLGDDVDTRLPQLVAGHGKGAATSRELVLVHAEGGSLQALDAMDGSVGWAGPDRAGGAATAVAVDEVVVLDGARLRSLDRSTGEERWSQPVGVGFSTVAVTDEVVVTTGDAGIAAFDRDGGERWRAATAWPTAGPTVGVVQVVGGEDDEVVVVADQTTAVGYDLATGAERWRRAVQVPVGLPAAVVDVRRGDLSTVLLADARGMHVIDPVAGTDRATSASIMASTSPADAAFRLPPTVLIGRDEVYRIDGVTVAAYDLATLAPRWSTSLGSTGPGARGVGGSSFTRVDIVRVACAGSFFVFSLSDGSIRIVRPTAGQKRNTST